MRAGNVRLSRRSVSFIRSERGASGCLRANVSSRLSVARPDATFQNRAAAKRLCSRRRTAGFHRSRSSPDRAGPVRPEATRGGNVVAGGKARIEKAREIPRHSVYLWTLPMFHCNGWCFPWTMALQAEVSVCLRKIKTHPAHRAALPQGGNWSGSNRRPPIGKSHCERSRCSQIRIAQNPGFDAG